MQRENLIGKKFGHLTVIRLDEEKTKEKKKSIWVCECDCEDRTQLSVYASNLKKGNTTKCKYCKAENLVGQKFNKLTVIKRVIDEKDRVKWLCRCDCGNEIIVRRDSLVSNHTKSCGCLQRTFISQLNASNLVGQKFGKLTVKKRSQRKDCNGQYFWICDCDCGAKNVEIPGHNLTSGRTYSCGCIKSKGEEKIAKLLSENNIPFIREYIMTDCNFSKKNGHPRFDFAIIDNNNNIKYFIEYQGEQHFISRGNIFTPEKVQEIQERDKEKLEFCKLKNIPVIYIKYTDFNTFTIKDLIL